MKKYIYLIIVMSLFSCQEVVDLNLETAQERLAIEAMIKWEKETVGNEQVIKLTNTSSYYNNEIVYAVGAQVSVTNTTTSQSFIFTEIEDGIYVTNTFIPIINNVYQLEITYNNEVYKAEETLFESPEILEITQSIEEGFSSEDPEVAVSFNDFENQRDFYRVQFSQYRPSVDETINTDGIAYDSRFVENNLITIFYESDDLEVNDEFTILVSKISSQFYNFINVLEQQGDSSGPFSTPPVNVKGNCINTTNESNYPYGYFGLNQISVANYTFEEF